MMQRGMFRFCAIIGIFIDGLTVSDDPTQSNKSHIVVWDKAFTNYPFGNF